MVVTTVKDEGDDCKWWWWWRLWPRWRRWQPWCLHRNAQRGAILPDWFIRHHQGCWEDIFIYDATSWWATNKRSHTRRRKRNNPHTGHNKHTSHQMVKCNSSGLRRARAGAGKRPQGGIKPVTMKLRQQGRGEREGGAQLWKFHRLGNPPCAAFDAFDGLRFYHILWHPAAHPLPPDGSS